MGTSERPLANVPGAENVRRTDWHPVLLSTFSRNIGDGAAVRGRPRDRRSDRHVTNPQGFHVGGAADISS